MPKLSAYHRCLPSVLIFVFQFLSGSSHAIATSAPTPMRVVLMNGQDIPIHNHFAYNPNKRASKKSFKVRLSQYVIKVMSRVKDRVKIANNQAQIGLVLCLLGLLVIPVLPAIPGIILCISALSEEKRSPGTLTRNSKSFAQVGIVLGVISFIALLLVLVFIAGFTHR